MSIIEVGVPKLTNKYNSDATNPIGSDDDDEDDTDIFGIADISFSHLKSSNRSDAIITSSNNESKDNDIEHYSIGAIPLGNDILTNFSLYESLNIKIKQHLGDLNSNKSNVGRKILRDLNKILLKRMNVNLDVKPGQVCVNAGITSQFSDVLKSIKGNTNNIWAWEYPSSALYLADGCGNKFVLPSSAGCHIPNKLYYSSNHNSGQEAGVDPNVPHKNKNTQFNLFNYNNCDIADTRTSNYCVLDCRYIDDHIKDLQLKWQESIYFLMGKLVICDSDPNANEAINSFYVVTNPTLSHNINSHNTLLPAIYFFREFPVAADKDTEMFVKCIVLHAPNWFVHRLNQLHCDEIRYIAVPVSSSLDPNSKTYKSMVVTGRVNVLKVVDVLVESVYNRTSNYIVGGAEMQQSRHSIVLQIPRLVCMDIFPHASSSNAEIHYHSFGEIDDRGHREDELSLKGTFIANTVLSICAFLDTHLAAELQIASQGDWSEQPSVCHDVGMRTDKCLYNNIEEYVIHKRKLTEHMGVKLKSTSKELWDAERLMLQLRAQVTAADKIALSSQGNRLMTNPLQFASVQLQWVSQDQVDSNKRRKISDAVVDSASVSLTIEISLVPWNNSHIQTDSRHNSGALAKLYPMCGFHSKVDPKEGVCCSRVVKQFVCRVQENEVQRLWDVSLDSQPFFLSKAL